MLVICGHFTGFTQIFPMPDQTAATIATNIDYGWIRYFGEPLQIHYDQETNFESDLMNQLWNVYGIEQRRTSPYHPQADGIVERFIKSIMNLIHGASEKKDWDEVVYSLHQPTTQPFTIVQTSLRITWLLDQKLLGALQSSFLTQKENLKLQLNTLQSWERSW